MDYEKCDTWPFAANLENFVISDDGVIFFLINVVLVIVL